MVEKLAIAPLPKLASPCELGPTMRMPAARARASIASWIFLPSAPVSPKPEAMITATFTPMRAHCSTACTVPSPASATIAISGTSGSAPRSAYAG